ncbi:MAG: hypothetical protein D6762_02690 [Candidatus Neomarinimicrobiota bacterium]|nr:MAG: hypothetical protein D6762_02690 [Candidatus Neomarinimicrobiota bacterium]
MKNVAKFLAGWLVVGATLMLLECRQSPPEPGSLTVDSWVDTTAGTIGDVFTVRVRIRHLAGDRIEVERPENTSSYTLRAFSVSPVQGDSVRIQYSLSVWDTGEIHLPAVRLKILGPDSTELEQVASDSLPVRIQSILAQVDDPALRPPKEPVPLSRQVPWRLILSLLSMGLLLAGMIWTWRKRQQPVPVGRQTYRPKLPPDKVAFRKLGEAEEWLQKDVREFYIRLSFLLREYLENSFFYKTLEMTGTEIRRIAPVLPIPADTLDPVLDILERADGIKYARQIPRYEEGKRDLERATRFVRETIPLWKVDVPTV